MCPSNPLSVVLYIESEYTKIPTHKRKFIQNVFIVVLLAFSYLDNMLENFTHQCCEFYLLFEKLYLSTYMLKFKIFFRHLLSWNISVFVYI